ncbi:regulator of chromosome condensation 1/beta-lactamase-inhibitor protein II [Ganoderma leucocontextum]|nr:regulator of chromosome condensation 1/beta-lactamase-inhibitor protein II [Ganoderma leucocontextum]
MKVAAGSCMAAALNDLGELRVWGAYYYPQNSGGDKFMFSPQLDKQPVPVQPKLVGERLSNVVVGANHLVLFTVHGDVYTMGQLGHKVPKTTPTAGTVPYIVQGAPEHRRPPRGRHWGGTTARSFFVDQQGEVWAWGLNGYGQTGTSSRQDVLWYAHRVQRVGRTSRGRGDGEAAVVQIAGGDRHTLFLASDGQFQLPKDDNSDARGKAKDGDQRACAGGVPA